MTDLGEKLKTAKNSRHAAKAALTRSGKALTQLLEYKRPSDEVRECLRKLKDTFENLVSKHEEFSTLIEDDEEFEKEESWVQDCQNFFMKLDMDAKGYIESIDKSIQKLPVHKELSISEPDEQSTSGMIGMQSAQGPFKPTEPNLDASANTSAGDVNKDVNITPNNVIAPGSGSKSNCESVNNLNQSIQSVTNNASTTMGEIGTVHNTTSCGFQMEKPKLPKFSGDVREYIIFRSDFKHIIESRYAKRDAITLLRTCLEEKPLELIKWIGSDYDTAWEYLDSIYDDARFVSDTITQDIVKFKALQDGEDARFCDLVHLVKRCYNTLKEVGIPSDMDNSHMLSIIEQKMYVDDRKVWSRDLERESKPATLHGLMSWMTVEMKSRMRATAPVRTGAASVRRPVNHLRFQSDGDNKTRHKCWLCLDSTHWPDQCLKFAAMSVDDRLKTAKDNHVCFSCLKRAGRDHRQANCNRRRRCSKLENGTQCAFNHHPLLHKSHAVNIGVATVTKQQESILPVISANICGPSGLFKRGNVLLDSGAQISLIRNETAESLGLNGKDISATITKIGGEEEEMKTKAYKVPVTTIDDKRRHSVRGIGIPCISEEIVGIRTARINEILGLSNERVRRGKGPVDLLIGIDHAQMHTGQTRQVDQKAPIC